MRVIHSNIKRWQGNGKEGDGSMSALLDRILSDENVDLAQKRVCANKGAGGVDGVTVQELSSYMKENWQVSESKSKNGSTSRNPC
jgi:retron-type reverse transcriptase